MATKFKPHPIDPEVFKALSTKPVTRRPVRLSRGEILVTGFLDSGVVIHAEKTKDAKDRDALAISAKNYITAHKLEKRIWARKLRGQENSLYLIDVDQAPDYLKEEFAAELTRNKQRTKRRKATMKK